MHAPAAGAFLHCDNCIVSYKEKINPDDPIPWNLNAPRPPTGMPHLIRDVTEEEPYGTPALVAKGGNKIKNN